MRPDRRAFIGSAAGVTALLLLPLPAAAIALEGDAAEAIDAILDGRKPHEGGIELDLPTVAENGAQVPVTVRVDSPMTEDDHVTAIHLVATANPTPAIGTFRLTPRIARAEVFTRIRLAEEQDILVLAETSQGRVTQIAVRVGVTVGGCAT